ncbi:MAG TPA: glycosyltransferase [Streptosporangiaceae bacterium]|nr:glycosyltransferase [Streptosporangiaceae bacterium]
MSVVIATRNRRVELLGTLTRLGRLPERPALIVVDNASADGTANAVRHSHPDVEVLELPANAGAAARNAGVRRARTRYVAFSDDDSWWEPGALARAAAELDANPGLGLVAARTLVGPQRTPDSVNAAMASSPLRDGGAPEVLGFLACACVVRRTAFLDVGGFSRLLFFVGEERLLAYDLAAAGWGRRYVPEVVAVHQPSAAGRNPGARRRAELRNTALTAWLRRPIPVALAETGKLARAAVKDADARGALAGLAHRWPRALAARRRLPSPVEGKIRRLEAPARADTVRRSAG